MIKSRTCVAALAAVLGLFTSLGPLHAEQFTTALGRTLDLPPVKSLDCGEMERVLSRIDATRYRDNAPSPHDLSDRPLYQYEMKLARAHYERCVLRRTKPRSGMFPMTAREFGSTIVRQP